MRTPPPLRREPGFGDPRDKQLYIRILRTIGPGGAAFFADAARILSADPPFQAPTNLAGHALRELDGSIRQALAPLRVESAGPVEEGDDKKDHRRIIQAILRGLELDVNSKVAKVWLTVAGLEGRVGFERLAHRRGLSAPRPLDASIRALWDDYRGVLEAVLDRFEARFLPVMDILDQLLAKVKPTGADAKKLAQQFPRSLTAAQYFFSRLENPAWIRLLREQRFFQTPPDPVLTEDGKMITITLWPESKYLARMATKAPREVLDTIRGIPDTQNTRVLEDFADALLTMPATDVASMADRAAGWVAHSHQFLLPRKLAALAAHLVKGLEIDAGFVILRELLLPERKDDADPRTLPTRAVGARFEGFEYVHILETHLPTFVEAAGVRTLALLCEMFGKAVLHPEDPSEDGSAIWRPALDRSEAIHREDIPDQLTTAVLRTALQILEKDASVLPAVLDVIEQHPQHLFRRIALYLLAGFPDPDRIGERLAKRALFEDHSAWYEYAVLLRAHFRGLTVKQQEVILGWIEEGPDPEPYRAPWMDRMPTEEEVQQQLRRWRWKRLALVAEQLPQPWKRRYEELESEFGQPKPLKPREPSIVSWHGPTSPISAEELEGMTIEEIVARLSSWKSQGGPEAPSPEGLGRLLSQRVAAEPRPFAAKAEAFEGLDPTYVRNLIFGLVLALKAKLKFPWRRVLELCRWVVDQPDPAGERPKWWADRDPDWSWTRTQVGTLLGDALGTQPSPIPPSCRRLVWTILERLAEDPDPADREPEADVPRQDPVTQSLNSVRGVAMRAVVSYALWITHAKPGRKDGRAFGGRGFDALPAVRRVLERHLDPTYERSPGVRAVYGQYLPQLVYLDRPWVANSARAILPYEGEGAEELRNAAWEAYLVFQNPYDEVFEVFGEEYARAVERLPEVSLKENGHGERPQERLAEHLMALYWRGKLSLTDPLLVRFFDLAPDPVRDRAITSIGLALTNEESEKPPEKVISRLRALWDWRLESVAAKPSLASELEAFGWWFASGSLGDEWAIGRLLAGLKVLPKVEGAHSVLERLASVAKTHPLEVLKALELMIAGDDRGWLVEVWRDLVRSVLRATLASEDPAVQTAARELVARLASRGYSDFRELLPPETGSDTPKE